MIRALRVAAGLAFALACTACVHRLSLECAPEPIPPASAGGATPSIQRKHHAYHRLCIFRAMCATGVY